MKFIDLLSTKSVIIDSTSKSKAAVLQRLSNLMHSCYHELDSQKLFEAYWERENLGSTAIGHGIMIPHICLPSINKTYACFIKLQNPIDFHAEDKQPVDLIFGLASATNSADQHLQILSKIVSEFSNHDYVNDCRHANSEQDLYDILTNETVALS